MIRRFRALGWSGPFPGKRHSVMIRGTKSVQISNPHGSDIDWSLTKQVLLQARIDQSEWDDLA